MFTEREKENQARCAVYDPFLESRCNDPLAVCPRCLWVSLCPVHDCHRTVTGFCFQPKDDVTELDRVLWRASMDPKDWPS